jgi:hypothetical protein
MGELYNEIDKEHEKISKYLFYNPIKMSCIFLLNSCERVYFSAYHKSMKYKVVQLIK